MNWTIAELDGHRHRGLVVAGFKGGAHGTGWSNDGIPLLDADLQPRDVPPRNPDDVEYWTTRCTCLEWRGVIWNRTKFPARESLGSRTLYAAGDEAAFVGGRADVGPMMEQEWLRHAHLMVASLDLANAARRVRESTEALEAAVAGARACGASWELIGTSAGISKQTAHDRWARLDRR